MNTKRHWLTFAAAAALLAVPVLAQSQGGGGSSSSSGGGGTSTRTSFRERYGILSDRNIFLKERRRPTQSSSATRPAAPPRQPEQQYVLTGVVYDPLEDRAYAFFEDLSAGTFVRAAVGDTVARGTISAIDLDAVAYERDGRATLVGVGNDLTGARASSPSARFGAASSASSSPAGGTTAPAAGAAAAAAPIDPNKPNLTAEEKMRLRRQQELKR